MKKSSPFGQYHWLLDRYRKQFLRAASRFRSSKKGSNILLLFWSIPKQEDKSNKRENDFIVLIKRAQSSTAQSPSYEELGVRIPLKGRKVDIISNLFPFYSPLWFTKIEEALYFVALLVYIMRIRKLIPNYAIN